MADTVYRRCGPALSVLPMFQGAGVFAEYAWDGHVRRNEATHDAKRQSDLGQLYVWSSGDMGGHASTGRVPLHGRRHSTGQYLYCRGNGYASQYDIVLGTLREVERLRMAGRIKGPLGRVRAYDQTVARITPVFEHTT